MLLKLLAGLLFIIISSLRRTVHIVESFRPIEPTADVLYVLQRIHIFVRTHLWYQAIGATHRRRMLLLTQIARLILDRMRAKIDRVSRIHMHGRRIQSTVGSIAAHTGTRLAVYCAH